MYAYCSNNPVIYLDPSGEVIITAAVIAGAVIGGAISLVSSIISEAIEGKIDWKDVKKSARKTIKKAAKKIGREYVSGQIEDFAYGGISKFSSFYIKSVVRIYGGG